MLVYCSNKMIPKFWHYFEKKGIQENLNYFELIINENINSKYIGYKKIILGKIYNNELSKVNNLKALT